MEANDAVIALRLPTKMKEAVEVAAAAEHRSAAGLIRLVIAEHLADRDELTTADARDRQAA